MATAQKKLAGSPLSLSAAEWNRHVDVADWYARTKRISSPSDGDPFTWEDSGIVCKMQNNSGFDADRFEALGIELNTVPVSPASNLTGFQKRPVLSGVTPETEHVDGRWALLLEPIADGDVGRVLLSGYAPANVDIVSLADSFVTVSPGSRTLKSSGTGIGQLLYQESGTGEKWCIIRVGAGAGGLHMVGEIAANDSPLASGSIGTIELHDQTGSAFPVVSSPLQTVEALNITTIDLYRGALMYVRPVLLFEQLIVSPAQEETCLVPTFVPNTDAIGGSGTVAAAIASDMKFRSSEISAFEFPESSALSTGAAFRVSNVDQNESSTVDLGANASSPLDKIENPNDPTAPYASSVSGVTFTNSSVVFELDKGAHYANPTWRVKG